MIGLEEVGEDIEQITTTLRDALEKVIELCPEAGPIVHDAFNEVRIGWDIEPKHRHKLNGKA